MSQQPTSEVSYRLAKQTDELAEMFYDLSEKSYAHGSPWTVEQFAGTLEQPHLFYILAEIKEEVVGFLGASMLQTEAEVYNIVVSSEHKRKGIGLGLLKEMKRMMQVNGTSECFLEVRVSNEPAILLYKRSGFQPVGVRRKYYSNPTEDAVVLKCEIG